ncbi:hypothetical protein EZV62_009534 [Acer yangbiense]|uniref:Uncharacterized protein n=1 Tax=Acer yangbiense TaxID=1000413 RepID=A0A5C7I054_9ROSI|nr:hypothetical protein EZV62_009534 [Acer yangbiense]
MVLEVFHYPTQTYVCNYADLMDYLINTAKDVDLLVEKGIIGNCVLDNEAIAKMFNTLCSHITPSESCFYGIAEKMKTHYTKATLRKVEDHCPQQSACRKFANLIQPLLPS